MPEQPPQPHETGDPKKNPVEWHGHRIVTEKDLDTTFEETEEIERPQVYMRRLRHGVVLGLLVVLLTAAVFVALGISRGDIRIAALEPDPVPTSTCPAGPFEYQDPAAITVNVFNSTRVSGLAGSTANVLAERAFTVGAVDNRDVNREGMTAIVASGPAGYANAFTLQRTIPNTVYIEDERTDESVDVVLGSGFENLVPTEEVDEEPGGLSCAAPESEAPADSATPSETAAPAESAAP